jgi:hypothetical protein
MDTETLVRQIITTTSPEPARVRPGRAHRRAVVAAVAGIAAVVAISTAFGADELIQLLNGQPAPPAALTEFPTSDLAANGVYGQVQVTATDGNTATLYSTQIKGRSCAYLRVTSSAPTVAQMPTSGATVWCEPIPGSAHPPLPLDFPGATLVSDGSIETNAGMFSFVYGQLDDPSDAIAITLPDGSVSSIPVSNAGYFLYELPTTMAPGEFTLNVTDASGNQVGQTQLPIVS